MWGEIYSTVWKGAKENQECITGDYKFGKHSTVLINEPLAAGSYKEKTVSQENPTSYQEKYKLQKNTVQVN